MYPAYKLNKQGIQPWHTPFPIWNQSIVPCLFLTIVSWPAYRFLRRQVRWSGIPISKNFPQFVMIHAVKGFSVVNEPEVGVFLEFSCLFYDPVNVGYICWIIENLVGVHKVLFAPSERLWWFWGLILNSITPLLPFCWDFTFALGQGYLLLVGSNILLLMVVQQLVEILVFSREKISACSFPLTSSLWAPH